MSHKLVIIVEILPYLGEDAQRVKREFLSDLNPVSKSHLKIISGPPRFIDSVKRICICLPANKRFEGIVEAENISYFPEENTITIVFYDHSCLQSNGEIKVSAIVKDYKKHNWEVVL
jgi:hypothetical protein